MSFIIPIFDLLTNTYRHMKTIDILKQYEKFVIEQKEQKSSTRRTIMESLLQYGLMEVMFVHGWEKKGKGTVTQGMVDTGIMKFDFFKKIKGNEVVVTINMNINDDYLTGGWNQILIKNGKPVQLDWWWKKGMGTHIEFDENGVNVTSDRFFLSTLLKNIEDTYI